jgi:hypothetical protein
MAEVRLTLEEYEALRSLIGSERESEGASLSQRKPKKPRKKNAWHKFQETFEFRKRKRNESNKDYLGKRSKAASRAYKKR